MKSSRRKFLQRSALGAAGLAAGLAGCASPRDQRQPRQVMTVLGPISATELGATLPHEHIFLDFIGAAAVSRDRYDPDEVFEATLPYLEQVKGLGCESMAECTPAYIGRDPLLLRRLARASGLHLLTNTGYYGASNNKFLPHHALEDSASQLATRWLNEWRNGIEGTDIRPGFIKIGVDAGRLSHVHRKLVRAAARAHRHCGLTIAAHTGDGMAAHDELRVLKEEGVSARAFIWVHAQNERDENLHLRAAEDGAWIEFDGISPTSVERHVALVQSMRDRGYLNQVLISHDAGWYDFGKPNGGTFRPYDTLFAEFLPALEEAGFSDDEIQQLVIANPREAFTIRIRPG